MPLIAIDLHALLAVAPRFDPGRANFAGFASSYAVVRLAALTMLGVVCGFMIQSYYDHAVQPARWMPVVLGGLFIVLGKRKGPGPRTRGLELTRDWTVASVAHNFGVSPDHRYSSGFRSGASAGSPTRLASARRGSSNLNDGLI
jgi:hypothetical protein